MTILSRMPNIMQFGRMKRAALWLVASDVFLQGSRYALVAGLGYLSFPLLGSFLFGAAIGSVLGAAIDFGISQHWLRLGAGPTGLTREVFLGVFAVKLGLSLIEIVTGGLVLVTGLWPTAWPLIFMAGLVTANLHTLADSCEAAGFVLQRHPAVALFRVLLGSAVYGAPILVLFAAGGTATSDALRLGLGIGIGAGLLILLAYVWLTAGRLVSVPTLRAEYGSLLRQSRWLGSNQLAVVVDVRAPLVLLGVMLGDTAVGLYGLVQRTTAAVELVWASLSKLLLKSYADNASARGLGIVQREIIRVSWITGVAMTVGIVGAWVATTYLERRGGWSPEVLTSFGLLRWAGVAIGMSSLKRPFLLGLIAVGRERHVCRVNVFSATTGLITVPLLVWQFGVWGPVIAAVGLEFLALLLLVSYFRLARKELDTLKSPVPPATANSMLLRAPAGSRPLP